MILVLPFFWALPMALSAELGSALPDEGGFYRWSAAPWASSGASRPAGGGSSRLFVDTAVYIALTIDYFQSTWGLSGCDALADRLRLIVVFTYINIRGLDLTGWP